MVIYDFAGTNEGELAVMVCFTAAGYLFCKVYLPLPKHVDELYACWSVFLSTYEPGGGSVAWAINLLVWAVGTPRRLRCLACPSCD